MIPRATWAIAAIATVLALLQPALAASNDSSTRWITTTNAEGDTVYLEDDRRPSLYTGDFGSCLSNPSIDITRFDAAYYHDNMTVLFHFTGSSELTNSSLMMYIGVFAYGESRFDLTFNPCAANIMSLCPVNSSVPIAAGGQIPINAQDIANIPSLAYSIPDFEGQAILRIFENETQSEIGCYTAVVTNGKSFSHPASVGTVLGIFTLVALVASFATAIYGEAIPTIRLHYAHSLSVGVVFSVWQHIYYTGALSMNWPSVLVAWWSNFAWAGGMIYSSSMQNSINNLVGNNYGNTSSVGAAASGTTNENLGGGYDLSQIYKRALLPGLKRAATKLPASHPIVRDIASEIYGRDYSKVLRRDLVSGAFEHTLRKREAIADRSDGYKWYGNAVVDGLPLPGNYSGFAGTLAEENIRASNAFMTGFLWFLILLVLVVAATMAFKWLLEGLTAIKMVKRDRLSFFRQHWLGYSALVALRACFIAFFMLMFLAMFQFTYDASGGVTAVAAIVFIIFLVGIPGAAAYAIWYKYKVSSPGGAKPATRSEKKTLLKNLPWFGHKKVAHGEAIEASEPVAEPGSKSSSMPFWKRMGSTGSLPHTDETLHNVHDDEDYTKKFGWLASRFRRTRWWFFAAWIVYEFIRACFYAGASGHPLTQVFGLLVVEILAFAFIIWARPFEGRRLNVLVVYLLGFSKVASVALSAAFDTQFGLDRIITTVIGIVIIVIQGILTVVTLIAVVVGAISSYMSVSRNSEDFKPRKWVGMREKYFDHLDRVVNDVPREKPPPAPEPEEPKYGFETRGVRRLAKIEDEDRDFQTEIGGGEAGMSDVSLDDRPISRPISQEMPNSNNVGSGYASPVGRSRAPSRAASIRSTRSINSLPYGARQHRPSWSTKDFAGNWNPAESSQTLEPSHSQIDMSRQFSDEGLTSASPVLASHSRANSRSNTLPPNMQARTSVDNIRIGGDVSSQDNIGKVPAPMTRPRAGTAGSVRPSRASISSDGRRTPVESRRASDYLPAEGGAYGRQHPLTPAQEMEEWVVR